MEKSERSNLHFKIVYRIGGGLFERPDPIENLPLGADYVFRISKLNKKRDYIFQRMINDLIRMDAELIAQKFSPDGTPITAEAKSWVSGYRREVDQSFRRLAAWYHFALFRTEDLADFEHWARSEFFSVDEVVWLSVGIEPTKRIMSWIKPFDSRGEAQKLDEVATYMARHKETLRRKFDPYDQGEKPDLAVLLEWIGEVKLVVHPKFLAILKARASSEQPSAISPNTIDSPLKMDGREKLSMSKLIAAMAIDGYGYDPKARRSNIPNEIQSIADRLGLDISSETIRKYLKKGAELIPEDWEPE